MHYRNGARDADQIIAVFDASFTDAEGGETGAQIAGLVRAMLDQLRPPELWVFSAWADDSCTGAILLSRLRFGQSPEPVYLLSPVAVHPNWQRQGVGQGLLRHGLDQLRSQGATAVVTYGDPAYYGKSGFVPVTSRQVPPPLPLSMPHGWQALSLSGTDLPRLPAPSQCVAPMRDPELW